MPTILHTGDEHIDSDAHGTINPKTGRNTAWESNYATVRHLAEQAVERRVDAFISAGDEFKTGRPSQEALMMLADAYTPLAEAGIPVLFLDGNHNLAGVPVGHRSAIWALAEIIRARGGVAVASAQPELVEVGGIQVATLPWLNKNAVLGAAELSPAEGDRMVAEWAHAKLEELANSADPAMHLIMAGHVTVAAPTPSYMDLRRGSEQEITHLFSEPILDVTRLEQLPFRYGALGHVHTPQTIGGGRYRYAGSPNRLTFTDEPDTKGGNLVHLSTTTKVEQIVTPARVMQTIDLAEDYDYSTIIEGSLVRVILEPGEMELASTTRSLIQKAGGHIVNTKARPAAKPKTERPTLAQTVSDAEALVTWAKAYSLLDADTLAAAAARLPLRETERVR